MPETKTINNDLIIAGNGKKKVWMIFLILKIFEILPNLIMSW